MQKSMVLALAAVLLASPAAGAATRDSISQQEVATAPYAAVGDALARRRLHVDNANQATRS